MYSYIFVTRNTTILLINVSIKIKMCLIRNDDVNKQVVVVSINKQMQGIWYNKITMSNEI